MIRTRIEFAEAVCSRTPASSRNVCLRKAFKHLGRLISAIATAPSVLRFMSSYVILSSDPFLEFAVVTSPTLVFLSADQDRLGNSLGRCPWEIRHIFDETWRLERRNSVADELHQTVWRCGFRSLSCPELHEGLHLC